MPQNEDTIARLLAELDELRYTISQLRAAIISAQKPLAIDDLLRAATEKAERPASDEPRQKQPVGTATARLAQTAEARLTAIRGGLRSLQIDSSKLQARLERAERDVWQQKAKRAEATTKLNQRERLLQQIQESAIWKSVKPLWKLFRARAAKATAAPITPGDLIFELDAPSSWKTPGEILFIKGWCLSRSGREIAGIRAKIGKTGRLGRYGLEREDVAAHFGQTNLARFSGFTIEVHVPLGKSVVQLEAIVQGSDWEPFFRKQLERKETPGAVDAPLHRDGTSKRNLAAELPQHGITKASKAVELLAPLFTEHGQEVRDQTPMFSIVTPTFNTHPRWFTEAALSLLNQSFANWEWCVVDDGSNAREITRLLDQLNGTSPRLRIAAIENAGISAATNAALDLATGEYVCFLDHDDLLASDALEQLADKLHQAFDVVYSDEDKLDDASSRRIEPFYKPEWSPEYFRGAMYIGHLLCVRRELAQAMRFDSAFDGVQDFEFMLRVSERTSRIGHISKILYHWRKTPGSIAENTDAKPRIGALQTSAVNAHLKRVGLAATAEPSSLPHRLRIVPAPRAAYERVSIIIPSKDSADLLDRCLSSLFQKTSYPNFEVVLVDNGTTQAEALAVMERYPLRRVDFPGRFNFSRANNQGVLAATGSLVVFLNNDTEIVTADWLHQLSYYAEQPDVGAAGALLVYASGKVQHAGVALGMRGTADHLMRDFPNDVDGYAGSLVCAREVSAVTAACMMMRKSLFDEIGGFNEHFFTAYQDLDLCLRLRQRGLRIIYTPQAQVVHHEWTSRKTYYDMVDRMLLLDQWEEAIESGDPYYNRHLNLERGDFSVAEAQ